MLLSAEIVPYIKPHIHTQSYHYRGEESFSCLHAGVAATTFSVPTHSNSRPTKSSRSTGEEEEVSLDLECLKCSTQRTGQTKALMIPSRGQERRIHKSVGFHDGMSMHWMPGRWVHRAHFFFTNEQKRACHFYVQELKITRLLHMHTVLSIFT
jgi:hypothetical protein